MVAPRAFPMLFRHLSHPEKGSFLPVVEGYALSLAAHVAVVLAFVAPGGHPAPVEEIPESFEWARFLLPEDKPKGNPAVSREHITYFSPTPAPGGSGVALDDRKQPEQLQLKVPEGTREDPQVGQSAVPLPQEEVKGDEVMTVLEVDTAATRVEDSAAPPYPPAMLAKRIEGNVAVQYIVDTTGRADTTSFVVLSTTHDDFARSVKETLPRMRFRAAKMNDTKVRQLVQQLFSFKIDTALLAAQQKKP